MEKKSYPFEILFSVRVIEAMKKMDSNKAKLLIVINDDSKYYGLLSIGDIQRAILKGYSLDTEIKNIIRNDYIVASPKDDIDTVKKMMLSIRAEFMPIVNQANEIIDVIFWDEIFDSDKEIPVDQFSLPVVIMAGGFGSRVKPLTNVIPKPLLPLGERTMLEEIFTRFNKHGSDEFYISVNYKSELIEYYLKQQKLPYKIECFKEEKPLGTAGSLHLLKDKLTSTFFVSNCDILIEQDYAEILKYHQINNNEITIVSAIKTYNIPYGTLITGLNGMLESLSEKPSLTFQINSGMYILEPSVLHDIPNHTFFHITHLIENLINENRKVGVFPVSEKSWIDMGTLDEYLKIIK